MKMLTRKQKTKLCFVIAALSITPIVVMAKPVINNPSRAYQTALQTAQQERKAMPTINESLETQRIFKLLTSSNSYLTCGTCGGSKGVFIPGPPRLPGHCAPC
jgi:hypothetical protein